MKLWMYTSLLWMALCFVAIKMTAEKIKENGWMVRAKNINDPMNLALFVLVMFVPILRVIFFGTIYYMASTREEDSDI